MAIYDFARTNFLNWSEDQSQSPWLTQPGTGSTITYGGSPGAQTTTFTKGTGGGAVRQNVIVKPGDVLTFSWLASATSGVPYYSVFDFSGSINVIPASPWPAPGVGGIRSVTVTAPAGCTQLAFYTLRDPIASCSYTLNYAQVNFGSAVLPYERQTDGQTLLDRSGNNNNGTLGATGGAEGTDPTWTAQGLSFDGVDDFVNVTLPAGFSSGTALVVGRYTTSPGRLLALGNGTVNNRITIWASSTNGITVEYADGSGVTTPLGYVTSAGVWSAYTARWTPTSFTSTMNADAHLISGLSSVTMTPTALTFGNANAIGLNRPLAGSEAYGLLYNRALTDTEVAQAYRVIKRTLAARGVALP